MNALFKQAIALLLLVGAVGQSFARYSSGNYTANVGLDDDVKSTLDEQETGSIDMEETESSD